MATPTRSGTQSEPFGKLLPFAEPAWYRDFNSPYFNASHGQWRSMVRRFVEKEILPHVNDWEEANEIPNIRDLLRKAGDARILAGCVAHRWPKEYIGEAPVDNFDAFHSMILLDEVARCGSGGVAWAFFLGLFVGLPPTMNFGSEYLKQKVVKDCLLGRKVICLAISEPGTASDVASIETTAQREGDHYVVNGAKKFISNGSFADYFTVAVRTGAPDSRHKGVSFLLLERGMPGFHIRKMKCQGLSSSGTAYLSFDDVRVPARNLIGTEGDGFRMIMYNFNHERWAMTIMANRLARVALAESFKYALKRETFGRRLVDHQAIRMKISDMARQVEAVHAWTEQITYQWTKMSHADAMKRLSDKIALLKVQSSQTLEFCAREALHIFGGSGYVAGGQGRVIERIYRDAQGYSIPGGAETIMLDYAARTAVRRVEADSKL